MSMGENSRISSGRKVVVKNIPKGFARDKLYKYFQKKDSGGGDDKMKSFVYPVPTAGGESVAVIDYNDDSIVDKVLEKQHKVRGNLTLRCSAFEPQIFESAKISLNKSRFTELSEQGNLGDIINEAGVEKKVLDDTVVLRGEWYQILCVGDQLGQLAFHHSVSSSDEGQALARTAENGGMQREGTLLNNFNELNSGHDEHAFGRLSDDINRSNSMTGQATPSHDPERSNGQHASSESFAHSIDTSNMAPQASQEPENGDFDTASEGNDDGEGGSGEVDESKTTGGTAGDDRVAEPNSDSTNSITVDKDIYDFLVLTKREIMDIFRNTYKITVTPAGDARSVEFKKESQKGIDEFQKIYQKTMDTVKQDIYDVPTDATDGDVASAISSCNQRQSDVHVSLMEGYRKIIVIGHSSEKCAEAMRVLRSKLGSRPEPPGCLFTHQFQSTGLTLTVCQGNIAAQEVDAIVNAANSRLRNGGGVTGAIFDAGGREFESLCRKLMRELKRALEVGEVVHTESSGRLRCKYVMHVTGPIWHELPILDRKNICRKTMEELCINLLKYTAVLPGCTTVAIPAIGTGIYGVPLKYFCDALWISTLKYNESIQQFRDDNLLREIRIVNFDKREAGEIVQFITKSKAERSCAGTSV